MVQKKFCTVSGALSYLQMMFVLVTLVPTTFVKMTLVETAFFDIIFVQITHLHMAFQKSNM